MIHFDSGRSLNGTYHFFTFEEDTLLEGKAWESIKFSHIQKAGPNRQCGLCVRVDFDSIKVSLSKNSVSSIWISSCRGFATFFGRTPTTSYEYNPTPFQHSKIRVLPPPVAPHGVSLAQGPARWDVGRPVLLLLVRARGLAQVQVQAPQRREANPRWNELTGPGTAYRHFRHGFSFKKARRLSWKRHAKRGLT